MNLAEELNILSESDFYRLSEKEAISKIQEKTQEINYKDSKLVYFCRLFNTFLSMKEILHVDNLSELPEPAENYFVVDIKVKQRYINPLVKTPEGPKRIYDINPYAKKIIDDFISYKDTKYGCVKLIEN